MTGDDDMWRVTVTIRATPTVTVTITIPMTVDGECDDV